MRWLISSIPAIAVLAVGGCAALHGGGVVRRYAAVPEAPHDLNSAYAAKRPHTAGEESGDEQGILDLDKCVEIALANNRRISVADRRVLIAKDRVSEVYSFVTPQLNGELRYTARNNDTGFSAQTPSLGEQLRQQLRSTVTSAALDSLGVPSAGSTSGSSAGGSPFGSGKFGDRNVGTAKLSLIVPIYQFGRAWHAIRAVRGQVDVSKLGAKRARQDVALAVAQAYYRVLEAKRIKSVVEESIQVIDRQLAIARDFFHHDLVARNDVLAVEVQRAQRQQELIQADNNVQLAIATLNRVMGIEVTQQTEIEDVLETPQWEGRFESVLWAAIRQRPDLASLKRQIEIAREDYKATQASLAPRFYGFADYNYSTDDYLLNRDWLSGGVAVEFPLFDGGQTLAQIRRKKKELAEAIDLHDERIDDIVLDVKQAYLSVRDAAERIPVAKKSIALATENLRIIRDQYAAGLVTSTDVLAEEERLSQARSNYYRSLYDYHTALARMSNVIGSQQLGEHGSD